MSKPNRLFEVEPDNDFGAGRRGEWASVREVPLQVVRQDVEEGERVAHHDTSVGFRHVLQSQGYVVVCWVLVAIELERDRE